MPLNTEIIRDGKMLKLHWGGFHIAAMALAACFDSERNELTPNDVYEDETFSEYPDEPFPVTGEVIVHIANYGALSQTPLNAGSYTLRKKHSFVDKTDGEVLELLPGDQLLAYRR